MSEQEIREGMLLAVWDEPPLDFDPDTLIRRVEQKKSRRRALVAVGVATAVIAVASFALPGLLPRDRDSQLGAETQTSAAPSATPSTPDRRRHQKIGDALADRLQRQRPEFKEVYGSFNWSGPGLKPEMPLQPVSTSQDSDDLYGFVYFTDAIGPTALLVTTGSAISPGQLCNSGTALFCRDVRQNDGSVVTEAEFRDGSEVVKAVSMRTFVDGRRSVIISSYSRNPSTGNGIRQNIPVGVDVLTALTTDSVIAWE
ncbi:hypothetical protein [Lentzea albida]|uniref:Uncharacterized protein n=1 Tax=Lentzea albida TaxID=65499 RepID=A0A1H9NKY9_9PSEU|nr:hypothetical protein [Lentzea albida]SER36561.1 hypothetical protein SAMN04488000_108204 [Lentzea albida]